MQFNETWWSNATEKCQAQYDAEEWKKTLASLDGRDTTQLSVFNLTQRRAK